jgi:2,3-bisphosphoglycerate-dependent phosphoglycerate mutase
MNHVTRVLAIRHGETAWNVDTRIQGQLDIPLNETGRWQAERLAAAVADDELHAIYASDLQRAHETAQAISRVTGLPITAERGLRERGFGSFEGHTYQEIEARWPEESLRWRKRELDFSPGGQGESLRVFYERCVNTAARLAAAHPGQAIAIVAHGGVMDCLYRAASRLDLQAARSWQLGNASINRLLYTPEGFTLVGWSDTSHLDRGSLDESNDRVGHAA